MIFLANTKNDRWSELEHRLFYYWHEEQKASQRIPIPLKANSYKQRSLAKQNQTT